MFLILLHAGCVSYIGITKTLPPEIELDEGQTNMQFKNLYDPAKLDFSNENVTVLFMSGVEMFVEGLSGSFNADPRLNLYVDSVVCEGKSSSFFPSPLGKDSISMFCSDNHVPLLLVLEAFDIYFDKQMEVVKNEDGSKSRTAHYFLVVKAGVSLYDSSGALMDRSMIRQVDHYNSRPVLSGLLAIGPSLAKADEEVNAMARDLGKAYYNKFYPSDIIERREYYTGKKFEEVTPYITAGNWRKAIELLIPLASSEDKKTSVRAAHNLSVVYEASGNEKEAAYWHEKSINP